MPGLHISRASQVEAVVRAACRRKIAVIAFEQLAFAVAIIFAGLILILLLGVHVLSWYWLGLFAGIGATVTISRTRKHSRRLSEYQIAQMLDSRLQLNDWLSTAWFLRSESGLERDGPAAQFQLAQAEKIANSVSPARAFPFSGQRIWRLPGALAAIILGLFCIRYAVDDSLKLQQSLIPIHLASTLDHIERSLSARNDPAQYGQTEHERESSRLAQGQPRDTQTDLPNQVDSKPQETLEAGNTDRRAKQETTTGDTHGSDNGQSEKSANADSNRQSSTAKNSETDSNPTEKTSESQRTSEQVGNNREAPIDSQQSPSNLLDKMRDAVSSLLAKMRQAPNPQKSEQNSAESPDAKTGEQQSAAARDRQAQSQRNSKAGSTQDRNSQREEQGQMEAAQASQNQNSGRSEENGSDAHSGVGRQNGDKDLKEAEQLQAMGKLAEIIGKRSANLTGEVVVETSSSKQQLKTEYSQRMGRHLDLGGEINRDEIPLMYQQYVRDYMEQVHKPAKNQQR